LTKRISEFISDQLVNYLIYRFIIFLAQQPNMFDSATIEESYDQASATMYEKKLQDNSNKPEVGEVESFGLDSSNDL